MNKQRLLEAGELVYVTKYWRTKKGIVRYKVMYNQIPGEYVLVRRGSHITRLCHDEYRRTLAGAVRLVESQRYKTKARLLKQVRKLREMKIEVKEWRVSKKKKTSPIRHDK